MFDGKRLKDLRLSMGLTQEELGKIVNVTKVSICCYENHNRVPNIETLLDLSEALHTTPNYLLGVEVPITLNEDVEEYEVNISKNDFEIIKELKRHYKLYEQLCSNSKRMIDAIDRKFN